MVENTFNSVKINTSEDAKHGVLCLEIIELKMKVNKIEGDEGKILFLLEEMGEKGYKWYKEMNDKPTTWEEMKKCLKIKIKAEDEEERRITEKIRMENEIEEKVKKEVSKLIELEKIKRSGYNRENIRKIYPNIICHRCNKSGHVAKWCKNEPFWSGINKNNENYLERNRKINFIDGHIKNENKRRKVYFEKICETFNDVIVDGKSFERVKFCPIAKCHIETQENILICKKGNRVPQALKQKARDYIAELLYRGILRKSSSQWRTPIRFIEKPDGTVRLVQNLIPLNDITRKDSFELPEMSKIVEAISGSKFITVLDLKEGYYQIEIDEKDKHKTAFEFEGEVFEWCGMVMGFKNGPMIFQRIMNEILCEKRGNGIEIYLDDVIIHTKTMEDHEKLVKWVLNKFKENNLKVNKKKIQYGSEEVKLLGLTINGKEKIPLEQKKDEALEYPVPTNFTELRRYLGLIGWFRDFIPNFSTLASDLFECIKQKKFIWKEKENNAFIKLKEALTNAKNLKLPEYNKEFILQTDASNTGIGAVLLQKNEEGALMPIQWASKKLTETEKKYTITEKEMLAIKWGIDKFSYQLKGRKFHLITDHQALQHIRTKNEYNNSRVNRWIEKIQEFDFSVEYKKGKELILPDALSRLYENEQNKTIKKKEYISEKGKKIINGKLKKHVIECEGKKFWRFDSGIIREIPEENKKNSIIIETHIKLQHRSTEAVYYELKKEYYWINMKEDINTILAKCETCIINNRRRKISKEYIYTNRRMEKVGIDILHLSQFNIDVLAIVDYFSRLISVKILENRTSKEILTKLNQIFEKIGLPENIISDNAKEFTSNEFMQWCYENEINHVKIAVEAHHSNGRIERVLRTLRDAIIKNREGDIKDTLDVIVEAYNNSFHSGIKCTPNEAWYDYSGIARIENSKDGIYQKRFKKGKRIQFKEGQYVKIAKNENLGKNIKELKGRFVENGIIVGRLGNNSYLVKMDNGRFVKKMDWDLKDLKIEVETPSREGDVEVFLDS